MTGPLLGSLFPTMEPVRRGDGTTFVVTARARFDEPRARCSSLSPHHDRAAFVAALDPSPLDLAMERYADGDDAAFAEVYDGLAPKLYAFLVRQTRDAALAEDLVQQTLLRIHRARGRFVRGAPVLPWAYAIARRLVLDGYRRGRRERLVPDPDEPGLEPTSRDPSADELASARETATLLAREMARLPDNQRVAFELVKQEGLSMAEAAAVLGTTVTAVKLRAHRAYEALRAALGAEPSGASRDEASPRPAGAGRKGRP